MNVLPLITERGLQNLLMMGNFGLEKENVRTDKHAHLALTPHPSIFGDKAQNPLITTDFAEAQIEMITPKLSSPKQALDFMQGLHNQVSLELDKQQEYLWPYSLPPILPQDDALIQVAQFIQPETSKYREYLASKYGKRKQLLSGVHYNFSFSAEFMLALHDAGFTQLSKREFNDAIYLKVARFYLQHAWLIIYLFGASPVAHESYSVCCRCPKEKITADTYAFNGASSFRNGVSGYRNKENFYVSYNSLKDYIKNIQDAIDNKVIIAAREYYSQIRLKGQMNIAPDKTLDDLAINGINYLEIRTLDLNPLTKVGITLESLEFIHLFLVYGLLAPDFCLCADDYQLAYRNQLLASDENRDADIMLHNSTTTQVSLRNWGIKLLQEMYDLFANLGFADKDLHLIAHFREQLATNAPGIARHIQDGVIIAGYSNFFLSKITHY